MGELCGTAIADLERVPPDKYDYDRAVIEFEQNLRIVDYFDYMIPESELRSGIASLRAKADVASPEHRRQATKIADNLLGVFRPRYGAWVGDRLKQISWYSDKLRFLSDLHAQIEEDYTGLAQFVADAIAVNAREEDLRSLETLTLLLESLCRLIDHLGKDVSETGKVSFHLHTKPKFATLSLAR